MNKFAVLLFTIALVASTMGLTDEQKKLIQEHNKKCTAETGASSEDIQNVKKGIFAEKPELHKYAYCFLKAANLVNEDGEPNVDVIKQKLGADIGTEEIDRVLGICKGSLTGAKEEKAAALYKCFYNTSEKHVVLS